MKKWRSEEVLIRHWVRDEYNDWLRYLFRRLQISPLIVSSWNSNISGTPQPGQQIRQTPSMDTETQPPNTSNAQKRSRAHFEDENALQVKPKGDSVQNNGTQFSCRNPSPISSSDICTESSSDDDFGPALPSVSLSPHGTPNLWCTKTSFLSSPLLHSQTS